MHKLEIQIPSSLDQYVHLLQNFFDGMIYKLDKNSHKTTPTINSIPEIIDLLQLEVDEFEEQFFEDRFSSNALVELCDTANFAFLAYAALELEVKASVNNA